MLCSAHVKIHPDLAIGNLSDSVSWGLNLVALLSKFSHHLKSAVPAE